MCLLCCRRTLAAYAADNDIVGMNGAHRLPNSACVQESSARCTVHTEYTADDGGRAWSQLYTGGITVMYGAVTRGDTELCFKPQPLNEDTREGLVGQTEWSQYFPDCGGSSQSPVDVVTTQTMYIPGLVPVTPLGYSQHGNRPFTLYNNGHTAVIELPEWMGLEGLPWLYTAVQMHLHWGSGGPSHGGSEHTINGLSADAELHVVHYNSELYPNISTAMTQKDGLAVLGILIVTGEETNPAFNSILNYLSRIRHADQKVPIPAFDVQSLLPKDLGRYYRYNGSLTTPPCYQSVLWTLFHERVQISKAQLLKLETILYSSKAEETDRMLLQDNYRATQPLNHRIIFASFSAESGKELSSGEVTAIVIGVMCGCVGLAVIVRFIVKTIRIKEPEKGKEKKQDLALNSTSEAEKKEEPSPSPQTEP
ncbi:carbonic anhydrase 14 isoform X4 [Mugil cephalus]|uniref:carbonic anhydrase 14 isoform X4 n=1 Tax=Mugil cephalus TaxID=48193 RepID=UPI001FB83D4B|nr:carbonic anhydrase 14 isoform X4 [Mugil cephalus]